MNLYIQTFMLSIYPMLIDLFHHHCSFFFFRVHQIAWAVIQIPLGTQQQYSQGIHIYQ